MIWVVWVAYKSGSERGGYQEEKSRQRALSVSLKSECDKICMEPKNPGWKKKKDRESVTAYETLDSFQLLATVHQRGET